MLKKKKNKNPFYSIFSFMQMHKINICQILFCVLEGKPLKKTELQPYKHPSPLSITSPQLVIFSLLKILTIPKLPSSALIFVYLYFGKRDSFPFTSYPNDYLLQMVPPVHTLPYTEALDSLNVVFSNLIVAPWWLKPYLPWLLLLSLASGKTHIKPMMHLSFVSEKNY